MGSLEQRLASLERSHRCWRACCAAMLIVSGSVFFLSAKANDDEQVFGIVKAKKFVMVNNQGEARGVLGWSDKEKGTPGGPGLALFSGEKRTAIIMSASELGGGVIDVYNSGNRKVVSMQANNFDEGMVATFRKNGEPGESLFNSR